MNRFSSCIIHYILPFFANKSFDLPCFIPCIEHFKLQWSLWVFLDDVSQRAKKIHLTSVFIFLVRFSSMSSYSISFLWSVLSMWTFSNKSRKFGKPNKINYSEDSQFKNLSQNHFVQRGITILLNECNWVCMIIW